MTFIYRTTSIENTPFYLIEHSKEKISRARRYVKVKPKSSLRKTLELSFRRTFETAISHACHINASIHYEILPQSIFHPRLIFLSFAEFSRRPTARQSNIDCLSSILRHQVFRTCEICDDTRQERT